MKEGKKLGREECDEKLNIIYALTLEERKTAFTREGLSVFDDPILIDDRWFSKRTLCEGEHFSKMLQTKQLNKEEMAFTVKNFNSFEKDILYSYAQEQPWMVKYQEMLGLYRKTLLRITSLQLTSIFNNYFHDRLKTIKMENITISDHLLAELENSVALQINQITWKCLVLDMEQKHAREFDDFMDFLNNNYSSIEQLERFYYKYPVLLRLLVQKTLDLTESVILMLGNIDKYYIEIDETLDLGSDKLQSITLTYGDTHDYGKSVAKILLDNGGICFYKPRNLYVERACYTLIKHINKTSNLMKMYINDAFYGEEFTIEGCVQHESCSTKDQVRNFYVRFGQLIALMTIMYGTDFHSENIIAHGEYPVIIDFETLFSQINFSSFDNRGQNISDYTDAMLATALVPTLAYTNNVELKGVEISGLAGGDAERFPLPKLVVKNLFTLEMDFEEKFINKQRDQNRPVWRNEIQQFRVFALDILDGFNRMFLYIYSNKKEMIQQIKYNFQNLKVRQIMKATAIYASLLQYANHPMYLQDMLEMERLLCNSYAYPYKEKKIVKEEENALLHMEIPLFYTVTTKRDLMYEKRIVKESFYKYCALQQVVNNLRELSVSAIDRLCVCLRIALGEYRQMQSSRHDLWKLCVIENSEHMIFRRDIKEICDFLCRSIWKNVKFYDEGKYITWEKIDFKGKYPVVSKMDDSFYDGRSGIQLLMDSYMIKSKDDKFDFLRGLLNENLNKGRWVFKNSFFEGSAGIIYNLVRHHASIELKVIYKLLEALEQMEIQEIDFLSGISGYFPLLEYLRRFKVYEHWIYKIISKFTFEIKDRIERVSNDSIGFGHGDIGLVFALLIADNVFSIDSQKEINHLLNRIDEKLLKRSDFNTSWCNGISGLGIAALACKKYLNHQLLDKFINCAWTEVSVMNEVDDMSICHGLGSEIEFLIEYQKVVDTDITPVLNRRISKIINSFYNQDHFEVDEILYHENYGLFTGRVGIGYILLRYLYPDISSILMLDFEEATDEGSRISR